ncbi:unnamed protein product [Oppiella nova]|uniref:Ketoreductase (KR) domain-containing protein n=1 Tax=Oppiella nova TaxID=334625 RepID=A0A7R9QQZ3_9ACAR|nr:unnamed protein product [Oppiella nova]CAG2170596.1 unnamed protein product [Oppiella nova]
MLSFASLTFEKFCSSIDTKHKIFANLDQLTRQLDHKLDYFVVFSSVTCGKGNGGQSNYSYGNSMCERICEQRRRDGLHGLAIQYGPIGDVGVFADTDQLLTMTSLRKQRINSCCDVLDKLLAIKQPIVTSYIKVDQVKESGNRQKRMVAELWRALGIDPETTPNHLTLGEIGLESMFAVELQQELEREWNMKVTLNQVKSITIGMLKDYESGNISNIRRHLDDIKRARSRLLKIKFIIPSEPYVRLNGVTSGKPVYVLPTLGLNFSMFEELAQRLNRPLIGLNWTRDVSKLSTLKEISRHYKTLLAELSPNGRYDVLGCFDTAIVCSKLLRKGLADKAVIIDVINDQRFCEDQLNDDFVLDPRSETGTGQQRFCEDQLNDDFVLEFMLTTMSSEIPESFKNKIAREVKREPDINAKVKLIVNEVVDFGGKGLVAPDLEEIFHIMLARIRMLSEYRLNKRKKLSNKLKLVIAKKWAKSTGKLVLIKPFKFDSVEDMEVFIEKSREMYFLPDSENTDANDNIAVESVDTPCAMDMMATEIVDKLEEALK